MQRHRKRKSRWAFFLLVILCIFFVSDAVEPFRQNDSTKSIQGTQNVQQYTMAPVPQLEVQTVRSERTAVQSKAGHTLRLLAPTVMLFALVLLSWRHFADSGQVNSGYSQEIVHYIHKTDGKKRTASM